MGKNKWEGEDIICVSKRYPDTEKKWAEERVLILFEGFHAFLSTRKHLATTQKNP